MCTQRAARHSDQACFLIINTQLFQFPTPFLRLRDLFVPLRGELIVAAGALLSLIRSLIMDLHSPTPAKKLPTPASRREPKVQPCHPCWRSTVYVALGGRLLWKARVNKARLGLTSRPAHCIYQPPIRGQHVECSTQCPNPGHRNLGFSFS